MSGKASSLPDLDEPDPAIGVRELLRARLPAAVVVAAFVLGLGLRVYHLDRIPRPLQTADEYAWTWAGLSLLRTGTPQSWSYLSVYTGGEERRFLGQKFTIVKPWLDHPPLFALLAGSWARLGGYDDPYTLDLAWMRTLPLLLWTATFLLLAIVMARLFDAATVAAAMVVFAVAPPMVLQSRLVISESLLVPLVLGGYLLVTRYVEQRSRAALAGLFAIALVLPLIKVPALSLCLVLLLYAVARRDPRLIATVAAGSALGVALYFGYGAHYGWENFRRVQEAHAGRFVGFNTGLTMLFGTKVVDEWLLWPLWFIGGIGMLVDAIQDRGRDLYLQALIYVGCMTFFGDQRSVYGWYWIPLYPAFAAGTGSFMIRMWHSRVGLYHAIWAVIAVPWIFSMGMELNWDNRQILRFCFVALMIVTIGIVKLLRDRRRTALQALCVLFVALQIGSDLLYVWRR